MSACRPFQSDLRHSAAIAAALLVALVAAIAGAGGPDGAARASRADSRLLVDPLGAMGVVRVAEQRRSPQSPTPSLRDAMHDEPARMRSPGGEWHRSAIRFVFGLPSEAFGDSLAALPPPAA
jgi:hypothetical protein